MSPRSYLYVPGDRPERFAKAIASGADAVILDLEDAVAADHKDDARQHVLDALDTPGAGPAQLWVRINSGNRGIDDTTALRDRPALTGVVVPKATPAGLDELVPRLGGLQLCALVETAAAVLELVEIAAHDEVSSLALGEVDLTADLGLRPSAMGDALWPVRLQAVVASAAHGLEQPLGPVWLDVADLDGLRRSTEALRDAGFGARQAVHPAQVAVINEVFTPTAAEIDEAEALLAGAAEAGSGVYLDRDGRMVDEAVLRSARRVLARADALSDRSS